MTLQYQVAHGIVLGKTIDLKAFHSNAVAAAGFIGVMNKLFEFGESQGIDACHGPQGQCPVG